MALPPGVINGPLLLGREPEAEGRCEDISVRDDTLSAPQAN
jgi:hypothetical protein